MNKIISLLIIGILYTLSFADIFGGLTKTGTTAAQFLKIQVGARAIGMGGAFSAISNDATSMYWNPAGLANIGNNGSVTFVHTNWLADTQYNFASVAIRAGNIGTFGISFTALSMPDMKVRTEFEPEGTGEYFSAVDLGMGLSYARRLTDLFCIGFTAKYIYQKIWHMTASTVAFDIGLIFRTDFDWLVLGINMSNFGPKLQYMGKDIFVNYDFTRDEWGDNENIFANLQTDKWDLPLLFRFGLGIEVLKQELNQIVVTLEARHPNDNTESVSFGAEYGFRQRFFLRAGYQAFFEQDSEKGLTAGAGFIYYLSKSASLKLDYAFADWGKLTNVHHFSIGIDF
jgi:hypothetical protein